MSLIGNITQRIRNMFGTRGSLLLPVYTPEVYADVTAINALEKGFNDNTAVYSIVMKDAEKFASIPRYVYSASDQEEKADKIIDNKLSKLLNRPNEYQSQEIGRAHV